MKKRLLIALSVLLTLMPSTAHATQCSLDWWPNNHVWTHSYVDANTYELGNAFTVDQTMYFYGWTIWFPTDQASAEGFGLWNRDTGAVLQGDTFGNVPAGHWQYRASNIITLSPNVNYMVSIGKAPNSSWYDDSGTPTAVGAHITFGGYFWTAPYGHLPTISATGTGEIAPIISDVSSGGC